MKIFLTPGMYSARRLQDPQLPQLHTCRNNVYERSATAPIADAADNNWFMFDCVELLLHQTKA